jgi:GntR family transcriptional regulator/MocR family aminotransferase
VHAERRAFVIDAIRRWIPEGLAWLQPSDQGMHLVLWLAPAIDDRQVVALAAKAGVALRAVSPTYADGKGPAGLILGFGGFTDPQIEEAARKLAGVIKSSPAPQS